MPHSLFFGPLGNLHVQSSSAWSDTNTKKSRYVQQNIWEVALHRLSEYLPMLGGQKLG